MASTAAVLNIVVKANTASAVSGLRKVDTVTRRTARSADTASKHASKHGKALKEVGHGAAYALGAGGFGGGLYAVFEILHRSIDKWHEAEQVTKLTGAALKSTGGAANVTAKHVEELSKRIEKKTAIDHLAIQTSENLLLTFPKIRNEAGKNNKIFDRATMAVTNLATALNHGAAPSVDQLHSASIQLGKALQDPIKGATALRRVGVALSASQQKQIKTLVAHGHQMEAQKIILRELSTEFGKAAEKTATPSRRLQTNLNDLTEELGKGVTPWLNKVTTRLNKFIGQMLDGTGAGGKFVGVLKIVGGVFTKILFPLVKFVATTPGIKQVAAALIGVGLAAKAIRFSGAITGVNLLIERLAVLRKSEAATTTIGGLKMHGPAKTGRSILPVAGLATAAVAAGALLGDKLMTSFGDKLAGIRTHGNIFQRAVQRWQQFGKDIGRVGTIIGAKLSAAWAGLPAPARRALLRVQGSFGSMGTEVKRISGRLKAIVPRDLGDMWSAVRRYFSFGARRVGGLYGDMGSGIKRITGRIASVMTGRLSDAWGVVRSIFRSGTGRAGKAFGNFGSGIRRIASRISSIMSAMGSTIGSIASFIGDAVGRVVKALGDLKSKIPHIGGLHLPSLPSIPGIGNPFKQRGGPISHGKPSGDSVPAVLERGEYVLNRKAVSKVGKDRLDALNFAAAPRFQKGGEIGPIRVSGSGFPADTVNSAAGRMRRAANRYLDRLAPKGGVLHGSGPVERVFARVAKRLSQSKVATLALGEAGFAESGMRDLSYGTGSSQGALQLLASTAAGLGVSPHDEAAIASLFFTRGFAGRGGANALARRGLPAFAVAQGVQGSATSSGSNYAAQEGPARAWMKRYGLQRGGAVGDLAAALDPRKPQRLRVLEGILPGMQQGGIMGRMIGRADQIDRRHFPYVYGGGHGTFRGPYDCSGAVSAVLHAGNLLSSPETSGALMGFGAAGPGAVTVYANPGHAYMSLNGRFFGTSRANPRGGAGWFPGAPRAGFAVRHVPHKFLAAGRTVTRGGLRTRLPKARPVKGLAGRLKNIGGIGLSKMMETRLKVLAAVAAKFEEYANRAETLGGPVFGHDQAYWLQDELKQLFPLRNYLIKAHNRIVELRKKIQKVLLPRARKHLKELRKHPLVNRDRIKAYTGKIIPALKSQFGKLGSRDGDLLSALSDVQGAGSSMRVMKHLPPVGELGGSIFDTQAKLKELGAKSDATDGGATVPSERLQSIIDLLREQLQQANLGKAVSEGAFQVFRDMPSFQTMPGQWHTVPGPSHQGVPAVVHGGEMVGRPGDTTVQVYVHPGGSGADVRVNGEWVRAEVRKVLRSEVSRVGRTPARAGT